MTSLLLVAAPELEPRATHPSDKSDSYPNTTYVCLQSELFRFTLCAYLKTVTSSSESPTRASAPSWLHQHRTLLEWALWGVVAWVIVFWRLGSLSLLDPDEAHYGQLTREMMRAHQWMVPLLDCIPFIDKPVLYHWLQAGAESIFGENEFALRLPSACAALALFWTVWWAGRALFGATVGRSAALMFATTPLTFALAGIGVFDMVYTAFLFGAVAALLVGARAGSLRIESTGWILLACAVMVKGPVALLLVVLFGVVAWIVPSIRGLVRNLH